jgi:hypothetical protein
LACRSEQYSGSTIKELPWSNWAELAGGIVETFYEPGSLADIVRVVQDAQAASKRIRVVGSGWAFEDIAYSPDVMVSLDRLNSVLDYVTDPAGGALLSQTIAGGRTLVHIEAGIKVATLNLQLAARNLAMPTLGGSNGQSIVGALTTSTHGGDFEEPPFCDLIHAIHMVGPGGQEYWIERVSAPITISARLGRVLPCPDTLVVRDDELFDAVAVSLGRFGIIYSVILEAVPAYSLARERTIMAFPSVINLLRQGIDQGSFLEPLFTNLPPPSSSLNAVSTRPRGMDLTLDSRNTAAVHVVRRWLATGPVMGMGGGDNALCGLGAPAILSIGAAALTTMGMNPAFVGNPLVLADPTRLPRLTAKQAELVLLAFNAANMIPGEAVAVVTNAYWDFDITRVPDVLSLVVFQLQFSAQRGPSYAVMTGNPTYDADGARLPHELHWCYRVNSCEIMFDAVDRRYIDFVTLLAANAPRFRQAGYISLRYSRRSRALLSMHNVASPHAVSIEVSTARYLRDSADWIEFVLRMAQILGGRPHWGQQNHPTPAQTQGLYSSRLDRWRAVLAGLSGPSTLFSSAFTVARELEPQGTRSIQIEGTASELASSAVGAISMLLLDDGAR